MDDALIGISIIGALLFIYAILGSIDFGTGFWSLVYERNTQTTAGVIANRFLSPAWKVTNVFLVLLVVALGGFFPGTIGILGTILIVPVSLVLIALTIRSSLMAYSYAANKYSRLLRIISGLTGLLIPGLLVSVLPVTLGGFIDRSGGGVELMLGRLFSSFTVYAHIIFGIASELFISALLLADYSKEGGDDSAFLVYRKTALILGPLTLLFAVMVASTYAPEAHWITVNIRQRLPLFGLSVLAFLLGYLLLFIGRSRSAVVAIVFQYLIAMYAYGSSHMPYIVYPDHTIYNGITNHAMFVSLVIGYIVGSVIMAPIFIWFWRLFLKDKRYIHGEK